LIRAVVDTNLLVSALKTPDGTAASIFKLLLLDRFVLVASFDILAEYHRVCHRPRLQLPVHAVQFALESIMSRAVLVEAQLRLSVSPDEADNRFLECAEAASADFLVTGNLRHFPERHGATRIVDARTFLSALERQD